MSHPHARCRITVARLTHELYTRHGEKRDPIGGEVFVAPQWLSETEVIAHQTMPDGWLVLPYRIDLKSGRVTELVALRERINGSRGAPWQVSPDRRWVLWPKGRPDPEYLCATRIDGRQHVEFSGTSQWGEFFGWLPGNRPVFLSSETSSHVADARTPHQVTALIYGLGRANPVRRVPLPPITENQWAGIAPDGTIVLVGIAKPGVATIARIDVSSARAVVQRRTVRLPIRADFRETTASLSPDGRHLAWRLVPENREGQSRLVVSGVDGDRLRTLNANIGGDVRWLPSGKAVSFTDGGDLYTMTVGP